jgi:2,3-bisphosphoglycerate-independent phosphoglycerate mutase
MYRGLARFIGLDFHQVEDSDDPGEDLARRLEWVGEHKGSYDFFHVHTKAADQAAHTKNPLHKKEVIELLDRGIGRRLKKLLDGETLLIVTADHSTPSGGPLIHSGEPVPIVAVGPGVRRDLVTAFDEIHCCGGALGQLAGSDLMLCVLNWLDRSKLRGLRDCDDDLAYWPGPRRPLQIKGS